VTLTDLSRRQARDQKRDQARDQKWRDPGRDPEARARLHDAARRGAPLVLARERVLAVPGVLGAHLPGGVLQRGVVLTISGPRGAGVTTAALALAAAATASGEWAGAVDLGCTLGAEAAAAAGVALDRFAVLRGVEPAQWAAAVAALLDGVSVVLAELPRGVRTADARRLAARARERATVLALLAPDPRAWPAEATLRVEAEGGAWSGIARHGALVRRASVLQVEGRGVRARPRVRLSA
jgi:hypothetical protein